MAAPASAARRPAGGSTRSWAPMVPRWIVYVAGFVPAVWALWLGINDDLGAEPIKTLEHLLGLWALRFLLAALAVTPLRQLAKVNLLRYRRALGLLAFYYAALHFAVYLVLDQGLDAGAIAADVLKRPYVTIGLASFLVLAPLAVTSTNGMIRRLGGKAWARLHRFVYLAAALAALHFVMVVKSWPAEPLVYAAVCAVLLACRAYPVVLRRIGPGA